MADKKYRYSVTSVDSGPETIRCIGYARCRRGRGGRVVFDRAYPEKRADFWDRVFDASVPTSSSKVPPSNTDTSIDSNQPLNTSSADTTNSSNSSSTFREYIENNKW